MDNTPKYKLHGAAKVCFFLSMIMLCCSLINTVLCLTPLPGIHIFLSAIFTLVSASLMTVVAIDRIRFDKKYHPDALKGNDKATIYLLIGVFIGFIWGKFIL